MCINIGGGGATCCCLVSASAAMASFDVFLELSSDVDFELSLASVAAMIRLDINSLLLLLLELFELLFCVSFCLCSVLLLGILIAFGLLLMRWRHFCYSIDGCDDFGFEQE